VKMRLGSCLLLVLGVTSVAQARMYQWVNPDQKNIQLSGIPPAWYRSGTVGPRVRVFNQGNLIDDTSIALPPTQREELRNAAFEEFQQRQQAEALRRLELAARRKALREKEDKLRLDRIAAENAQQQAQQQQAQNQNDGTDSNAVDAGMIDKLKSLVGQFDRQSAKQITAGAKTP